MQCLISVAVLEHLHLPLHPDTQRDSHAFSIDVAVPAGGEWCGGKFYMFDSTQYICMQRQALVGRELPAIPGYLDPDANFDEETHMITNQHSQLVRIDSVIVNSDAKRTSWFVVSEHAASDIVPKSQLATPSFIAVAHC
jgi:hypothetical protein